MRLFRFIALFALAVSAQAQTWFTVVPASAQSTSTTITMPVGAQYRFSTPICGATGKPAASATGTATASPVSDWDAGAVDPCPGTAKEFDVLETAATGTIITLVWPSTTTAYVCSATQNDTGVATAYLGLGHSVATATGMTISAGISVIGTTFNVDYSCTP